MNGLFSEFLFLPWNQLTGPDRTFQIDENGYGYIWYDPSILGINPPTVRIQLGCTDGTYRTINKLVMLKALSEDEQKLAELMSWISEEGYTAGWMNTLEFDLWEIINGGDRRYGHYDVTQNGIDQLNSLSQKCGCWIIYDEVNDETAIALPNWVKMYEDRIKAR